MSLPDRVKIWLTWVNRFLPKFWLKVTPLLIDRRRYSTANCGRMVGDTANPRWS